ALVAFHTKQIDDAVAAGKLASERASAMKANLKEHVTKMVERIKGPKDGLGKGKKFGHGPRA
ncbi:MAG: hypothetical protein ACKO1Z_02340, partial [Actinomycetota bacterium]